MNKERRDFIDDNDYADDAENAFDELEDGSSEEEDSDEEPFDSVCCICDNGGSLLWYVYFLLFFIRKNMYYKYWKKGWMPKKHPTKDYVQPICKLSTR